MQNEMLRETIERRCPFARENGMQVIEVSEEGTVTMAMEESEGSLNAFGIIHAGAICGLAETAGGAALMKHLDPSEFIPLNTVLNIRFIHPARGTLKCSVKITDEEFGVLREEVAANGKADKAMDLKIFDAENNLVAEAQATFRIMPTPPQFRKYFV